MQIPTTLTQFILEEEHAHKNSSGSLTLLLTHIEDAIKIIASHVKQTGIVDILGESGKENVYGEDVQKLDEFANELLCEMAISSKQVFAVASEEEEEFVFSKYNNAPYIVFFDPLDGSSNINTNASIGTIFSIYKRDGEDYLKEGSKIVASGYAMYGSSVMVLYSTGFGVNGFTLDPSIGSFLLSDPNVKIPLKKEYSINEAYYLKYDKAHRRYLDYLKNEEYSLRYIGTLVSDIHRVLMTGGIYLYPSYEKYPEGKLRLIFELSAIGFLVEQAGGLAVSYGKSVLDIRPTELHQRSPIAMGSKELVENYIKKVNEKN